MKKSRLINDNQLFSELVVIVVRLSLSSGCTGVAIEVHFQAHWENAQIFTFLL
jgi:hypothetical protein